MTQIMTKSADDRLWSTMPGWGIVADLTPPELVEARSLARLRRIIAMGILLLLPLCAAGVVFADARHSDAQAALNAASQRTTQLTVDSNRYSDVTSLQDATQSLKSQIATLMTTDVDTAALVQALYTALPQTLTLNTVNVSLTGPAAVVVPGATASATPIGSVTLAGASLRLGDLTSYVRALAHLRGVIDVIPSSNTAAGAASAATWTVTLQVTDTLYTHRFDVSGSPAVTPTTGSATPTPSTGGH